MERVQTIAHSIYISRYQPGLEATVAWGIFDMKFRNDTPNAVFITSSITNGSMTVSLWGTKEYDDIEAEFGERKNIRKFTTVYDESEDCLGQSGVDGFTITVDRVFYKDGEEVKREPITTTYKPAPEVICKAEPKPKPDKGRRATATGRQRSRRPVAQRRSGRPGAGSVAAAGGGRHVLQRLSTAPPRRRPPSRRGVV